MSRARKQKLLISLPSGIYARIAAADTFLYKGLDYPNSQENLSEQKGDR